MDDVKFNFDKLTARRMTAFFTASRANDYDTLAEIFAATAVTCPKEWGNPNDANTYLDLPFMTTFQTLIKHFVSEAQATAKN